QEVDEETFFNCTQSGGTVVSTALEEMHRIIGQRYPASQWNIYAAQASDGDNSITDSERCIALLDGKLMRLCQYFAYVEIIDDDAIEAIAVEELHLDIYPVQMEIISSQQMLDAYSSVGMPLMYRHWSFGKHFLHQDLLYRKGGRGLAYELVINSNPCIVYLMEENTMALQALVTAHAALGHNHFFKNNHLFKQWTDAGAILGYLDFAKSYIVRCEERHGLAAVEAVLDSAHALMEQGVFRYQRPPKLSSERLREGLRERLEYEERSYNDLWRTLPHSQQRADVKVQDPEWKKSLNLPEENLLYFLEKNSPVLEPWQREIIRIVRVIAQYFYPQRQTQVMNEGCATFVHYTVM
ncbi:MAG: DUF444 family protein, partial [Mesorhizobium sp.]